eukprot:TRINITY_DN3231_c1_g2_i1.p1 TRINITY_DN3231_c1_g2~~TRINITY_DN3231_c1_g2_i1.p1  ORF type:complete len:682 (-),score=72.46 TRINITY_DN3231_c1_g2_i1:150-2195(-)
MASRLVLCLLVYIGQITPGMRMPTQAGCPFGIPESVSYIDGKDLKLLGSGAFGTVCLGEIKADVSFADWKAKRHSPVAIKQFTDERKSILKLCHREQNMLTYLTKATARGEMSHVVQFLSTWAGKQTNKSGRSSFYMAMQGITGGDLNALIRDTTVEDGCKLPSIERLNHFHGLLKGIQQLHALGAIHRDLKPANLLVSGGSSLQPNRGLYMTDLGSACCYGLYEGDQPTRRPANKSSATTAIPYCTFPCPRNPYSGVTPYYMSPALVAGLRPSPADDMWALGVILYQFIRLRFKIKEMSIFRAFNQAALVFAIMSFNVAQIDQDNCLDNLPVLKRFLKRFLQQNARDRITADEAIAFLANKDNYDELHFEWATMDEEAMIKCNENDDNAMEAISDLSASVELGTRIVLEDEDDQDSATVRANTAGATAALAKGILGGVSGIVKDVEKTFIATRTDARKKQTRLAASNLVQGMSRIVNERTKTRVIEPSKIDQETRGRLRELAATYLDGDITTENMVQETMNLVTSESALLRAVLDEGVLKQEVAADDRNDILELTAGPGAARLARTQTGEKTRLHADTEDEELEAVLRNVLGNESAEVPLTPPGDANTRHFWKRGLRIQVIDQTSSRVGQKGVLDSVDDTRHDDPESRWWVILDGDTSVRSYRQSALEVLRAREVDASAT